MSKALLIVSEKTNYFFPFVQNENILIDDCWDKGKLYKYKKIYKLCNRLQIPIAIFFGKWTRQLREFSKIIIFDGCFNSFLKCYLDRHVPNTPKYIFCWNPRQRWERAISSINYSDKKYPVFSYSMADSKSLGIYHQSTFYTKDIQMPIEELRYDWIFVGRTKQRGEWIDKIYKWSEENRLAFFLHVYDTGERPFPVSGKLIKYEDYLQELNKSRAILDIANQNQDGLSLRVMESLFFNKKLITTNESICNYDFYRKENIFILKDGFERDLKDFFEKPYYEIAKDIKEYYLIENWIERFN